eukprot:Lankesteria_metandrocarpae@DN3251_c0_g1_i2.p1
MDVRGDNNANASIRQDVIRRRSGGGVQASQCTVVQSIPSDGYYRPYRPSLHFEAGPSPRCAGSGSVASSNARQQLCHSPGRSSLELVRSSRPTAAHQHRVVVRSHHSNRNSRHSRLQHQGANALGNGRSRTRSIATLESTPAGCTSSTRPPTPSVMDSEFTTMTSLPELAHSTALTSAVDASPVVSSLTTPVVHTAASSGYHRSGSTTSYFSCRIPRHQVYVRGSTVTSPPRVLSVSDAALNGRRRSTAHPIASRALTGGTSSCTNNSTTRPTTAPYYPTTLHRGTNGTPAYVAYQQLEGPHRLVRSRHTVGHATAPVQTSQPGLNRDLLCRLPTRQHNRKTDDELLTEENKCCPICRGDYTEEDLLRLLPCLHSFHQTCVDEWLKRDSRCPSCRTDAADGILKAAEQTSPLLARQPENCENTNPNRSQTVTELSTRRSSRSRRDTQPTSNTARTGDVDEESVRAARRRLRRSSQRRPTADAVGDSNAAADSLARVVTYDSSRQSPTISATAGGNVVGCLNSGDASHAVAPHAAAGVRRQDDGAASEQQLRLGLVLRQSPLVEHALDGTVVPVQGGELGRRRRHTYTGTVLNAEREGVEPSESSMSAVSAASSWNAQVRQTVSQYMYGGRLTPTTQIDAITEGDTLLGSLLNLWRVHTGQGESNDSDTACTADDDCSGGSNNEYAELVCRHDGCMGSFKRFMLWVFSKDACLNSSPNDCTQIAAAAAVHTPAVAGRTLTAAATTVAVDSNNCQGSTNVTGDYFEAGGDDMLLAPVVAVVEPYWIQTSNGTGMFDTPTDADVAVVNSTTPECQSSVGTVGVRCHSSVVACSSRCSAADSSNKSLTTTDASCTVTTTALGKTAAATVTGSNAERVEQIKDHLLNSFNKDDGAPRHDTTRGVEKDADAVAGAVKSEYSTGGDARSGRNAYSRERIVHPSKMRVQTATVAMHSTITGSTTTSSSCSIDARQDEEAVALSPNARTASTLCSMTDATQTCEVCSSMTDATQTCEVCSSMTDATQTCEVCSSMTDATQTCEVCSRKSSASLAASPCALWVQPSPTEEEYRLVAVETRSAAVNDPLTPKMPPHCEFTAPLPRSLLQCASKCTDSNSLETTNNIQHHDDQA